MEENILDSNTFDSSGLNLDNQAQNFLQKIAFWAKFLGIVSLIFGVLTVLGAFFVKSIFGNLGSGSPDFGYTAFLTIAYIFIGFLFIFPGYKLVQFATKIKAALSSSDKVTLNKSINNLLAVFRFYGILTMIMIVTYGFGFVILLVTKLVL